MRFETNPLPGMNPWLEEYWGDVHSMITSYARDSLQPTLPDSLVARVEEYVTVSAEDADGPFTRNVSPDVRISRTSSSTSDVGDPENATTATLDPPMTEPVLVRRSGEPLTLRRIRILDTAAGGRVVTAIEFLSPANKCSDKGRAQYLRKQKEFLEGGVNLVEIDLIRRGHWMLAVAQTNVARQLRHPYRICVTRAVDEDDAEMYDASFHFPLPAIGVPLREQDDDARLDLQRLVDDAYRNGRYGTTIDYTAPPAPPPLADIETRWIDEHLAGLPRGPKE